MDRHGFLHQLHKVYKPRNYLEVGVNDGRSLALSRVASVAVDPAFKLVTQISCDVHLVKATSDDFFARKDPLLHLRPGRNPFRALARKDPLSWFGDPKLELSFIDGMHIFEYALRDFMNVERHSRWSSVIVLDDMLPRSV
ncbi:class I SAM-dependent methyltransferase, partial [Actinacidiphila oryziradicis]|uniref:class I SAM-dependent methyltransferase n=1 Tax=Actinacidiphila oryziradicis TaxID=2571141 RepID=UPI003211E6EC|nr:methyltransferase type 11 [Actinacidiphila oryziradicis]